jgi:predicted PurR-regulated permease PerM
MRRRAFDPQWLWLAAAFAIFGAVLYMLSPILAPFVTAAVLAYISDPLVDRLERRMPRTLGALLVMLGFTLLVVVFVLILVPLFVTEARQLYEQIPGFMERVKNEFLPWLNARLGVQVPLDLQGILQWLREHMQTNAPAAGSAAGLIAGQVFASIKIGGLALVGFLVNALLVPVVFFYMLRDWDVMVAKVDELIPRRWRSTVTSLTKEVDRVLAEFLRGQLSVMVIMAALYTLGLWAVGLQFALPIGMVTGLLVFIPYLGSVTGILLGTIAAFMQFQSIAGVIPVWIVFAVGQTLEGMFVTPYLVGDRIGLHPVAVIFALLAFGQLFGFVGVLLALPLSAVLLVGLRHARELYRGSRFFRRAGR